jgi:hypothetical protein
MIELSPIHTFVNIPALLLKNTLRFLIRAGILTKVWIGDISLNVACKFTDTENIFFQLYFDHKSKYHYRISFTASLKYSSPYNQSLTPKNRKLCFQLNKGHLIE